MKLHRTLLALGLAALTAPAFAADDSALTDAAISLWDTGDTFITMDIDGHAHAHARSGALIEQTQDTSLNLIEGDVDATATLGDALDSVSGNIGVNIASGAGNAQSNNVALSAISGEDIGALASAMVFSDQTSTTNTATATWMNSYDASVTDGALANASGNIGVNVAAGVGNAQGNALAASINSDGDVALATGDSNQVSGDNWIVMDFMPELDLTASLDGGALNGATGNIGVNIASGVGNVQHNSLSIAANGGL